MNNTVYQREWYRKHADKINEKRRRKIPCPYCEKLLNTSSMKKHRQREMGVMGVVWKNKIV